MTPGAPALHAQRFQSKQNPIDSLGLEPTASAACERLIRLGLIADAPTPTPLGVDAPNHHGHHSHGSPHADAHPHAHPHAHPGHADHPSRFGAVPGGGAGAGSGEGAGHGGHADCARDGRLTLLLSWADWRPSTWVQTIPPLLEPLGVTSVRAGSARDAERVIRSQRVHIAVVDLGLPLDRRAPEARPSADHAGTRVLELLRRLDDPPPTVVLKDPHTSRDEARHLRAALDCDAFAVVDRAAADAETMLKVLMRAMERYYRGRWPGQHWNAPFA